MDDSLGGWLHRVACRIALQVSIDARTAQGSTNVGPPRFAGRVDPPWTGMTYRRSCTRRSDRLPERFRKPIVLCYLEEMTYQQAASQLSWSEGTTRGRLAKAREMLRVR